MGRQAASKEVGGTMSALGLLARQYLEHLQAHAYAKSTIVNWEDILQRFTGWCEERALYSPCDVSRSHIERYQRHLYRYIRPNGQPLSLSTQRGALVVIRGFSGGCRARTLFSSTRRPI